MFRSSISAIRYLNWGIFVVSRVRFAGLSATKTPCWPQGIKSSVMIFVVSICLETLLQKSFVNRSPSERAAQMVKENDAVGAGCLSLWMQYDNVAS